MLRSGPLRIRGKREVGPQVPGPVRLLHLSRHLFLDFLDQGRDHERLVKFNLLWELEIPKVTRRDILPLVNTVGRSISTILLVYSITLTCTKFLAGCVCMFHFLLDLSLKISRDREQSQYSSNI